LTASSSSSAQQAREALGLRLREIRLGAGLTASALAAAAGALAIHAGWGDPAAAITSARLVARRPEDVVWLLRDPDAVTANQR
jgi:hypothetical protein